MPPRRSSDASGSRGPSKRGRGRPRRAPSPSSSEMDDYSTSDSSSHDGSPVRVDHMNERIYCGCMVCKGKLVHMRKNTIKHIDKYGKFVPPASSSVSFKLIHFFILICLSVRFL